MDASRNREGEGDTSTSRTRQDTFKSVGGNIKDVYFVFGKYDMVVIAEAPSDEAMGKAVLIIGSRGAASIQTLKAFSQAEGLAIIKGLP